MLHPKESDRIGQAVNVAEFAKLRRWRGAGRELEVHAVQRDADGLLHPTSDPGTGEWQVGLEWDEPRAVRRVEVRLPAGEHMPEDVSVQYWRHNWPTPAPERLPGARRGWIGRDDPYNGHWVTVRAAKAVDGQATTYDFDPVDIPELFSTSPSGISGSWTGSAGSSIGFSGVGWLS